VLRGDSEAPVIAVPLDLIRKKRVQPDKSGDARSLVLSLFNKCPTSLSVFSQTMPTVKFGEIEPHSEDILCVVYLTMLAYAYAILTVLHPLPSCFRLAASLRSLRCEGDQHQHQQLVPGCVVPLLVAPLKVITAKLGPQQVAVICILLQSFYNAIQCGSTNLENSRFPISAGSGGDGSGVQERKGRIEH
jgi:hypothetical protein